MNKTNNININDVNGFFSIIIPILPKFSKVCCAENPLPSFGPGSEFSVLRFSFLFGSFLDSIVVEILESVVVSVLYTSF